MDNSMRICKVEGHVCEVASNIPSGKDRKPQHLMTRDLPIYTQVCQMQNAKQK